MSQSVLMVIACLATIVTVTTALVVYGIARAVVDKATPESLPEILRELSPLLSGLARVLTRARSMQARGRAVDSPTGQLHAPAYERPPTSSATGAEETLQ